MYPYVLSGSLSPRAAPMPMHFLRYTRCSWNPWTVRSRMSVNWISSSTSTRCVLFPRCTLQHPRCPAKRHAKSGPLIPGPNRRHTTSLPRSSKAAWSSRRTCTRSTAPVRPLPRSCRATLRSRMPDPDPLSFLPPSFITSPVQEAARARKESFASANPLSLGGGGAVGSRSAGLQTPLGWLAGRLTGVGAR